MSYFRFVAVLLAMALLAAAWPLTPRQAMAEGQAEDGQPLAASNQVEYEDARSRVRLLSEGTSIQPGQTFNLGLHMELTDPAWHIYYRNPGDPGMPPSIEWDLPEGFEAGEIIWPTPVRFTMGEFATNFGYKGDALLIIPIQAPETIEDNPIIIKADVEWQACDDEMCVPGEAELEMALPVRAEAPAIAERWSERFSQSWQNVPPRMEPAQATATYEGSVATLHIYGMLEAGLEAEDVFFYPSDEGVIAPGEAQPVQREGHRVSLRLTRDEFADAFPEQLRGVVSADTADGPRSVYVDVPLRPAPDGEAIASLDAALLSQYDTAAAAEAERVSRAPAEADYYEWSGAAGGRLSISLAIIGAFIGGLILNLMPCVFPVLSIKIMGFVSHAGHEKKLVRRHGYFFGLGVLASFLVLAGLLMAIRAAGDEALAETGWGFQLQNPVFVAALAALMVAVGLNLAGVFEVGSGLMNAAAKASERVHGTGYATSFSHGILATALATPCTAPFMGGAIGYALTAPQVEALLVFAFLGVGMATPYVVLSIFPAWLKLLPKPGAWMETFKQVMAFPMFAVAAWLIWLFHTQTDGRMLHLFAGLLVLAIGLWVLGRWTTPWRRQPVRIAGMAVAGLLIVASFYPPVHAAREYQAEQAGTADRLEWVEYSEDVIEQARQRRQPVFVDFTADWCITCKFQEYNVLETSRVRGAVRDRNIKMVKADWTQRDPTGDVGRALAEFGRNSVPLYVVYSSDPDHPPVVLPTVITPGMVERALDWAASGRPWRE